MPLHRVDRLLLACSWIGLVACTGDGRADSTTTFGDEAITLDADDTPEGSGEAESSSEGQDTGTTAETDGGIKFDIAGAIDLPGDPIAPSCATIDDYPATSVGCEFFAVQVPSYGSELPYGIAVGNPSAELATVTIEDMRGPGGRCGRSPASSSPRRRAC